MTLLRELVDRQRRQKGTPDLGSRADIPALPPHWIERAKNALGAGRESKRVITCT
jgi:hypothetical protein